MLTKFSNLHFYIFLLIAVGAAVTFLMALWRSMETVRYIWSAFISMCQGAEVKYDVTTKDIKVELLQGNILLVPVNGQKLNNSFFTTPGPIEHMIVIYGYDKDSQEFITNDPGTKRGKAFRYPEKVISSALQDYPTGYHLPIQEINTAMIIIKQSTNKQFL